MSVNLSFVRLTLSSFATWAVVCQKSTNDFESSRHECRTERCLGAGIIVPEHNTLFCLPSRSCPRYKNVSRSPFTCRKNRILEVQQVASYAHLRTQAGVNLCGTSMLLSFPSRSYSFSERTDKGSCYDLNMQTHHGIGVAIEPARFRLEASIIRYRFKLITLAIEIPIEYQRCRQGKLLRPSCINIS